MAAVVPTLNAAATLPGRLVVAHGQGAGRGGAHAGRAGPGGVRPLSLMRNVGLMHRLRRSRLAPFPADAETLAAK